MTKPYTLICHAKAKKPYVVGHYNTLKAAESALAVAQKKNDSSKALMKKYPSQGIKDLFCDLQIIGPT